MNLIVEFFVEIIFRRLIVEFLGFYKLIRNSKGLARLNEPSAQEGEEFGKGCIISIVGMKSFAALLTLIVYLFF